MIQIVSLLYKMKTRSNLSFGDHVRIVSNPLTQQLGFSGLAGKILGVTTPTLSEVTVIGDLTEDFAVNVNFPDKDGEFWFAAELVEFVDHAPGTEISIGEGAQAKSYVRSENGEWIANQPEGRIKKPWWEFWS